MFPELTGIKSQRQRLGIKQKELANISRVSQSLIAKIEAGIAIPSYDIVKRIFHALESKEHTNEKKCSDIMTKNVVFVKGGDKVSEAVRLMKKYSVSQLPVSNGKEIVGSISELSIYNKIVEGISKKNLMNLFVQDIMAEPFPVIRSDYPLTIAIPLLKSSEAILLTEKHKIIGIITKANLL